MAEAAPTSGRALLRVFTHPACAGCGEAVRRAAAVVAGHGDVELRTVRLEEPEGLAEARGERVLTIPTTILERDGQVLGRWIGALDLDAVERALGALAAS